MLRRFLALALVVTSVAVAQEADPAAPAGRDHGLLGRIEGDQYYAPSGSYRITIPLVDGLDGQIIDTPNVVSFRDPYSTYITVWCHTQDAPQKWQYEVQGPKEALEEFFYDYVWRDFAAFPGAAYDTNARFQPRLYGGALFTFITLPGGSMFANPQFQIDPYAKPIVAKRGNMLFVHDGYIYVISTELAERVTQRDHYTLTDEEENILLRDRLTAIASRIHFLK
ncbi:MAG TPA: hypothetical protein VFE31_11970 [Opitutaceae bacterium]|jgi:hypothetical protein|nr:hypothetical protein [Opitutaceae bacterium]